MKKQTEREFYDKLNKLDSKGSGDWVGMAIICAISSGVVGFILGVIVQRLLGSL